MRDKELGRRNLERLANPFYQGSWCSSLRRKCWCIALAQNLRRRGQRLDLYREICHSVQEKEAASIIWFEENKITLLANYENNLLHGKWFRYQYGELAFSAEYRRGKLHGLYKEYRGEGKVAKEISYTDGELDGPYRFFDDRGNVVLEYTYRKGKKIGD